MTTQLSLFHQMLVDFGTDPKVIEKNKAVEFVAELRKRDLVTTWVCYFTHETCLDSKDGSIHLRAPTEDFPTPAIYAQLLLVFG